MGGCDAGQQGECTFLITHLKVHDTEGALPSVGLVKPQGDQSSGSEDESHWKEGHTQSSFSAVIFLHNPTVI